MVVYVTYLLQPFKAICSIQDPKEQFFYDIYKHGMEGYIIFYLHSKSISISKEWNIHQFDVNVPFCTVISIKVSISRCHKEFTHLNHDKFVGWASHCMAWNKQVDIGLTNQLISFWTMVSLKLRQIILFLSSHLASLFWPYLCMWMTYYWLDHT